MFAQIEIGKLADCSALAIVDFHIDRHRFDAQSSQRLQPREHRPTPPVPRNDHPDRDAFGCYNQAVALEDTDGASGTDSQSLPGRWAKTIGSHPFPTNSKGQG
jgi:hypothetical protein